MNPPLIKLFREVFLHILIIENIAVITLSPTAYKCKKFSTIACRWLGHVFFSPPKTDIICLSTVFEKLQTIRSKSYVKFYFWWTGGRRDLLKGPITHTIITKFSIEISVS